MNIYVGNLSYDATEGDLRRLFEEFGELSDVRVISDRDTGRSRGFAFVEMASADDARNAIGQLNDAEFMGRKLTVNEARERSQGGGF